jgi:hypothetical protein
MAGKVLTGNRAKVYVDGKLVGIFDSCNYSSALGTEDIFILGSTAAKEIAITSQEVVTLQCSGFRVVGNGVHVLPKFPKLADLMQFQGFTISVIDRATGVQILTVLGCVPTNTGENYNAKTTSKISIGYKGLRGFDESGDSDESDAADLP